MQSADVAQQSLGVLRVQTEGEELGGLWQKGWEQNAENKGYVICGLLHECGFSHGLRLMFH